MKKIIIMSFLLGMSFVLASCSQDNATDKLVFATSAEYPPFEYKINGELVGFDIELGKIIAQELGKEAEFLDMQFSSILIAVQSGMANAAISTITITDAREKNFDFSKPYYMESMAVVFNKEKPIKSVAELAGKKMACQLGTTMEIWLKKHAPNTKIITNDSNPQAIEALKAGYVDGVLIDSVQGATFSKKNEQLFFKIIIQSDTGYGVAFKKGSLLKDEVNKAIASLEKSGAIKKLKKKYMLEGG